MIHFMTHVRGMLSKCRSVVPLDLVFNYLQWEKKLSLFTNKLHLFCSLAAIKMKEIVL